MNKIEIEKNIIWNDYSIGSIDISIPLFNKKIKFELFSEDNENPSISDKMYETIKDILNLPLNTTEIIKELLWEECNFAFTVADYGCIPLEGETDIAAHFREFELHNPQDAFDNCFIKGVQIHYESDSLLGRYAQIQIDTATDNLISIIVKNGKIIDYDDNGTYLAKFENEEQKAHKNRMEVLKGYESS